MKVLLAPLRDAIKGLQLPSIMTFAKVVLLPASLTAGFCIFAHQLQAAMAESTATPNATQGTNASSLIGIATALAHLAWPIVAIIGLFCFKKPFSSFLEGLSYRVTKLSAFKIELELSDNGENGPTCA